MKPDKVTTPDDFDSDQLSDEQQVYLMWRRSEPQVGTVSEAEALAWRAFSYGLKLGGGLPTKRVARVPPRSRRDR